MTIEQQKEQNKKNTSTENDEKMRMFVNMIIDRVLEDRKQGIKRGLEL